MEHSTRPAGHLQGREEAADTHDNILDKLQTYSKKDRKIKHLRVQECSEECSEGSEGGECIGACSEDGVVIDGNLWNKWNSITIFADGSRIYQ